MQEIDVLIYKAIKERDMSNLISQCQRLSKGEVFENSKLDFIYFLMLGNKVVYIGSSCRGNRPNEHTSKLFNGVACISTDNAYFFEQALIKEFKTKYNKCFNSVNYCMEKYGFKRKDEVHCTQGNPDSSVFPPACPAFHKFWKYTLNTEKNEMLRMQKFSNRKSSCNPQGKRRS